MRTSEINEIQVDQEMSNFFYLIHLKRLFMGSILSEKKFKEIFLSVSGWLFYYSLWVSLSLVIL